MSIETERMTAAAFADEFAQLGYTRMEILGLFRAPFYAAVHRSWRTLGEDEIVSIVDRAVMFWRDQQLTTED
jgi:hypothetical protein